MKHGSMPLIPPKIEKDQLHHHTSTLHRQPGFCSYYQIYEFHIALKYMARWNKVTIKGCWSISEWKAVWEVFRALFFFLLFLFSAWMQYVAGIDCSGPVVSQRLSPLTNPFAACQRPPLSFLLIDWYASSHCNYTMRPAGHLFLLLSTLRGKKKSERKGVRRESPLSLEPSTLFCS